MFTCYGCSVKSDENGKEASEKTERKSSRCAREGNRGKKNVGEEKRTVNPTRYEFCDQITRKSCEGKAEGWGRDGEG